MSFMNEFFNSKDEKKDLILDVSFLIYNGSFAFSQKCCKDGCEKCDGLGKIFLKHNGEISGGLYLIFKTLFEYMPDGYNPILVFDPPKLQLDRSQLIEDYKGNRAPKPDYITRQLKVCKEVFSYTDIECYSSETDESDDVISTIALERAADGNKVIVVTDDKDMFPLLAEDNISLLRQKNIFTKENFVNKFGFCPSRFSEYLAIVGDAADNYNIIKGLGPKAAVYLISKYDNIIKLFDDWDNLPNKYKSKLSYIDDSGKLIYRKDDLELSLKLAQLNLEAKYMKINKEKSFDKTKELLDNIGIKSAINRINMFFRKK